MSTMRSILSVGVAILALCNAASRFDLPDDMGHVIKLREAQFMEVQAFNTWWEIITKVSLARAFLEMIHAKNGS